MALHANAARHTGTQVIQHVNRPAKALNARQSRVLRGLVFKSVTTATWSAQVTSIIVASSVFLEHVLSSAMPGTVCKNAMVGNALT